MPEPQSRRSRKTAPIQENSKGTLPLYQLNYTVYKERD